METLKLGESGNYFNENNCMLQPKCRQPYIHNDRKMKSNMIDNELSTPKLPPRPPLPKVAQSTTTIDRDLAKQQQLSDWYYIKTGPKSPLPAIRSEKQIDIHNGMHQTAVKQTNANISNISGYDKSNEISSISGEKNTFGGIRVAREVTKNTQNTGKHIKNDSPRLCENIQMVKTDAGKNVKDTIGTLNHSDVAFTHQYSVNEPLCKFNYCNNSENVNGCSKRQQPHENPTPLILPPSPSVATKKVHQQQSHPFYYIEASQKHLSSPRHGAVYSQQKIKDLHCEQSQRLTSTIITSNSNSNIHKTTGIHSQQINQSGNANSSSFEHINVTSVFSPLSASSEMAIDNKRHLKNQNYADERIGMESNFGVECRPSVSSSPYLPVAHQSKVSRNYTFYNR